jgi:hypothetical protein
MRKTAFFSIGVVLALLFIGIFAVRMEAGQEENRHEEDWHHRDHPGDDMHRHAPVVVAEHAFKGQLGSIPLTTLFTPACNCMYRVTAYTEVPDRSLGYGPVSLISWTDDFAQSQTEIVQDNWNGNIGVTVGAGGWAEGQFILHSVAKQPIQFSTNGTAPIEETYNIYVVVEEL